MLVRGNRRPPPTPTNTSSDPKLLHHPFWVRGLALPWQKQTRHKTCCRQHTGWRIWPHAPEDGGGLLCIPLCFWAAQFAVGASELCIGTRRSQFSPYLPPNKAAAAIQCVYHSSIDKEWEWWLKLSWDGYALGRNMNWAMHNLWQWLSMLDGVGDLFPDKVFFFRSSLFWTTIFYGAWSLVLFSFSWLHLLYWFLGLFASSFSLHLHMSTTCASVGGCYNVEYLDLSTLVRAHSS